MRIKTKNIMVKPAPLSDTSQPGSLATERSLLTHHQITCTNHACVLMHLLMLSLKGGGGGGRQHMWGIWPLLSSPPSGIWLRTWVPRWGRLLFLRGGMGSSHVVACARLCTNHLGIRRLFLIEASSCFYINTKTLLLTTHFQAGYNNWSDLTKFWGPTVAILTKNSSEKSNAPHKPGVPPLGLILIDA